MKEVHQHSALSEEEVEPFLRDDSPFVSIQFTDDGSGIPDEVITNIFNPFFTTKPVDKGTAWAFLSVELLLSGTEGIYW